MNIRLLVLLICVILAACSKTALPTQTISIAGQKIIFEVADEEHERSTGLMGRSKLPRDRGMMFTFQEPRQVEMWMKDVDIPLDIVFLRDGVVKAIDLKALPCEVADRDCPRYRSGHLVDMVLEFPAGRVSELGIKEGDRLW